MEEIVAQLEFGEGLVPDGIWLELIPATHSSRMII